MCEVEKLFHLQRAASCWTRGKISLAYMYELRHFASNKISVFDGIVEILKISQVTIFGEKQTKYQRILPYTFLYSPKLTFTQWLFNHRTIKQIIRRFFHFLIVNILHRLSYYQKVSLQMPPFQIPSFFSSGAKRLKIF